MVCIDGIDNKLRLTDSRLAASGPLYFLQDHLGSTTTLTNSVGVVAGQVSYDSFGNSAGSPLTRYDYTGRERDPDTGLMYYRARWYDPHEGRFISEDPIGFEGGVNFYAYVQNDPLNAIDPEGLVPKPQSSDLNPEQLKKDFYKLYQKKLACCVWQVFSKDLDEQPLNTAQVMPAQSLTNAPNVDMSQTMGQLGGQGKTNDKIDPSNGRHGTIHLASDLHGWTTTGGQWISARENWFRTYAHELGNLLSARYTGDGNTFGTRNGITGAISSIKDYDTGARLEKCMFGNGALRRHTVEEVISYVPAYTTACYHARRLYVGHYTKRLLGRPALHVNQKARIAQ